MTRNIIEEWINNSDTINVDFENDVPDMMSLMKIDAINQYLMHLIADNALHEMETGESALLPDKIKADIASILEFLGNPARADGIRWMFDEDERRVLDESVHQITAWIEAQYGEQDAQFEELLKLAIRVNWLISSTLLENRRRDDDDDEYDTF